jgi:hypothetical protein
MRNPVYDLPTEAELAAALAAPVADQASEVLKQPARQALSCRWQLQPAPAKSPAFLAALKRQAEWEAQSAERAAERSWRDRDRADSREAKR